METFSLIFLIFVSLFVGFAPKWIPLLPDFPSRGSKRLAELQAKQYETLMADYPTLCNNRSPDDELMCRLEINHDGGWHTDGTRSWYGLEWKRDN